MSQTPPYDPSQPPVPPNWQQQGYPQTPPPNWQQNPYQQNPPAPGFQPPFQTHIPPYNPFVGAFSPKLEGARNAQICGIIGLVLFFNIIGIILNIVAIVQGNNAINEYERNPSRYPESEYSKAKTGKTCGTIGLSLFGLGILVVILLVVAAS
jgi:hypothetical protein